MKVFREIVGLLHAAMGYDSAALSESTVVRGVRRRMLHCGQADEAAYLIYLRASPQEMTHLIEELVVPETWFFRDGKPFEWLRQFIQEEWGPVNPKRPLRILSVPCSSGEEPYSAVITALDAGLPPERILVDAVDISHIALGKARRGVYGRNSFRNSPPGLKERYFSQATHGLQLDETVRRIVHFSQANLLADDFTNGRTGYDVIFCRNLLIYFDDANRERALSVLEKILLPHGILFVGHAEGAPVLDHWFVSAGVSQAFAYRKKGTVQPARPQPRPSLRAAPPTTRRALPPPAQQAVQPAAVVGKSGPVNKPTPPASVDHLAEARRLADQGKLAEAALRCEAHLREHGPSAEAFYLLGLVHDAGRDAEQAKDYFGKAVYLEPDHYEALVHLALLAEQRGEPGDAKRWRQRAERAAGRRDSEQ